MPQTGLPDAATTVEVMQLAGAANVGLMLDTWHLLRGGGTVADIQALPPWSLRGVQLNDRLADASQPSDTGYAVSERLLPGEGDAPLGELVRAIVHNTPTVPIEVEVFNSTLASVAPENAAARVAAALKSWRANLPPLGI